MTVDNSIILCRPCIFAKMFHW